MQFLKFNMVGLLNTAVDFAVFAALTYAGMYYVAAQLLSYAAGMLNSYILNSRFTFGGNGGRTTARTNYGKMVRFIVWNGIMLGLSVLLLIAFAEFTPLEGLYAKAVVTVITVIINFFGSKKFVFVQGNERATE